MLRDHSIPTPPADPVDVVLTCGDPTCQHTFEPDRQALAVGLVACPRCAGWTFRARLAEPTRSGGGRS